MKIPEYIQYKLDRFPKGYVFTYVDFVTEVNKKEAIIKSLNRMAASGKINKLSKGRYFKPEDTPFGTLEPDRYQVVKDLLEKDGKVIGYLTGYSAYRELGLTTQVGNTLQIGRKDPRPGLQRGRYKVTFIRQKNTITKENIPLLKLLDAIKYIKTIPDTTVDASCTRLIALLKKLSSNEQAMLIRLAQKYPPATRALLGALLELSGTEQELSSLYDSLNPITTYDIPVSGEILPTAQNWNIK